MEDERDDEDVNSVLTDDICLESGSPTTYVLEDEAEPKDENGDINKQGESLLHSESEQDLLQWDFGMNQVELTELESLLERPEQSQLEENNIIADNVVVFKENIIPSLQAQTKGNLVAPDADVDKNNATKARKRKKRKSKESCSRVEVRTRRERIERWLAKRDRRVFSKKAQLGRTQKGKVAQRKKRNHLGRFV